MKPYDQPRSLSDLVIQSVAFRMDVLPIFIIGPRRTKPVVEARHMCAYLLKRIGRKTLTEVADKLNRCNHTTILHALRRMNRKIESDPETRFLAYELVREVELKWADMIRESKRNWTDRETEKELATIYAA